ncbi:hypothetical protein LSTR_LSTR003069 [Laodelphax striatellus]|uniref:Fibronectin type-III domain-containing protein n=1 Tax=Laodelphax striatellus TaxID=195883 RepID=A0A482WW11_LAOST|nr:hypothetical protein LSTR_LSTR003069 [Laodelphax striatellus]
MEVRSVLDYVFLAKLFFVFVNLFHAADCTAVTGIGSPLRVAQCRAECIFKFSKDEEDLTCMDDIECLTCWKSCQQLSNFNKLCLQNSNCGAGCEAACQFAQEVSNDIQRSPVMVKRGEDVLQTTGQETRWPPPAPELDGPWVYLVMRKLKKPGSSWKQITQTLNLSAKIPLGGMVRVLVVGRGGLVTIYGPAEETTEGRKMNEKVEVQTRVKDKGWRLRQVSVIHQEAVVIAEVAWEARQPRALYLVTWEVAGGGLRGNLLTASTSVALSLWPDTQFHVQVELMNPGQTSPEKSEELLVDTHKETDNTVLTAAEPPRTTTLMNALLKGTAGDGSLPDEQVEDEQEAVPVAAEWRRGAEVVAGLVAAVALFVVLVVWRCHRRWSDDSPHVKLVEDEYLTSDHFQVISHRGCHTKPGSASSHPCNAFVT